MMDHDNLSMTHCFEEDIEEMDSFLPHQVFVHHVDTFNAKQLASYLSDQIKGAKQATGGMAFEGDEEEAEQHEKLNVADVQLQNYRIVGTLKCEFHHPTEDVRKVIKTTDSNYEKRILQCGYVIFDAITNMEVIPEAKRVLQMLQDQLKSVEEVGPKTFAQYEEVRVFVLISNVLTWALTKPIDPDDPETPFTESDFKKRKCHPNYRQLIDFEREVIAVGKKFKDKLKTYVICSGVIYGLEEEDLFYLFKTAWQNETLPLLKPGTNYIPLIHIKDLIKIIHGVLESLPKKRYILAVEQTPCTLKSIVRALTKRMGNGKMDPIEPTEAYRLTNVTQRDYECLTLNLRMEPVFVVEDLELEWQNELNLAENMAAIVNEFKTSRKLRSINVILHGPPAVGKTTLAKFISERYGNHYVTVKTMIDDTINNLRETIESEKAKQQKPPEAEETAAEEEEEDEEVDVEELEQRLHEIENVVLYTENGRLPDEDVARMMKAYLNMNFIQNQGYVLDGYPKTYKQAIELFGGDSEGGGEEAAEEEDEGDRGQIKPKLLPDCVIALEANDEFLCNRIMMKPEAQIQGTHYTEDRMMRRLELYRLDNTDDNTVLNYFDEREIHPILIDAMTSHKTEIVFSIVAPHIGSLNAFELTEEEERECYMLEMQRNRLVEEEERIKREIMETKAKEAYENQMEEWSKLLEELQMEEEKLLVAQCEPLRNYLMTYVFPTLTRGLLEVARIKPTDPIDFLAEYLFKENPEGRMFDPSYTRTGELIERKCKEHSKL